MPVFENIAFQGIEGIRVGRTNRALNTTCIVYRLGNTIIDTGPSNQWKYVRKFVEERDVDRIMITHHYEDHSGNGARLQKSLDAPVLMPPSGIDVMKRGFTLSLTQEWAWGKSRATEVLRSGGIVRSPSAAASHTGIFSAGNRRNRGGRSHPAIILSVPAIWSGFPNKVS